MKSHKLTSLTCLPPKWVLQCWTGSNSAGMHQGTNHQRKAMPAARAALIAGVAGPSAAAGGSSPVEELGRLGLLASGAEQVGCCAAAGYHSWVQARSKQDRSSVPFQRHFAAAYTAGSFMDADGCPSHSLHTGSGAGQSAAGRPGRRKQRRRPAPTPGAGRLPGGQGAQPGGPHAHLRGVRVSSTPDTPFLIEFAGVFACVIGTIKTFGARGMFDRMLGSRA
jgi:hypothetical protein